MPDEPQVVTLEPTTVAMLRETVPVAELPQYFDRAFHTVMAVIGRQGLQPTGPPVGVYYSMPSETVDVGAGFPVGREVQPDRRVTSVELSSGRAVQVVHQGSYESMTRTYEQLMRWVGEQDLAMASVMWETYLTEPTPEDPDSMLTQITWPLS